MTTNRRRFCCLAAGMVATSAFVRATGAGDDETRIFDIALNGGKIANADTTIRVTEGDKVELRWSSNDAVELHLHGYNIEIDVKAGATGTMSFEAYATGRFPIVAHGHGSSHAPFAYLEVHPE